MPCVIIPVKELVKMCRDEGVDRIFIDGAHAIGNMDIDVKDIGADFYTSNLHKWLFCPPSAAFLYLSHEYGNGLAMESSWIGTRDYSAQLVLPEVMEFVSRFEGGIKGIMKKNHETVVEMAKMLAEAWGTELGAPPEMCASLAMVGLPGCLGVGSDSDALRLRRHLRECFKVEVPIYYRAPVEGEVETVMITGYARISHQVYNVVEDYYRLRDAVYKLVESGITCALLSKLEGTNNTPSEMS
ncbi:putative l-cysteine desulfhydrase 1 [Phtheirospermum japonicum]|uniref:Putative l-cysteine desulfhydrase 1 n=1 Tax=Phtheirospermum japonicum TaxID=374723 RepID=A0A830BX22_9LAMI|nr:putative l-cysteine desulfhydrase 1 [Phtheirospermum japonicum]